ncbi:MAG: DUF362 domain-containing protein [Peptococcaceae bacterium]|jgi:uncharacterized protein (DUF362 family)/ferredoxin|nr:DUF362 domain-containing protein [Peptococcaceae bacterium]
MEKVALCKCQSYEEKEIADALYQGFDLLAAEEFLPGAGQIVFLKTNLLMAKSPKSAVVTHPAVVEAVAAYFCKRGARVIIGDSPGGPFLPGLLKSAYHAAGLIGVAERTDSTLNYDVSVQEVLAAEKTRTNSFSMVKAMLEADAIISLAKLKTHSMMMYSGAAKNMYGAIAGMAKVDYHLRLPNYTDFAHLLVDVCETVKPVFSIIDGIVAMEGNGPSGGMPRQVGALVMGKNPYAVDWIGASVLGMSPEDIPMLAAARERGLVTPADIHIYGEELSTLQITDLQLPDSRPIHFYHQKLPGFLSDWLDNRIKPRVRVEKNRCIGCGKCVAHCPPRAMSLVDKVPKIAEKKCICCFCCQELCPEKAIEIYRGWLGRFLMEHKKS